MRLSVRHVTAYDFDKPMRFVTQSHRLTPANSDGQKVAEWRIDAEGAAFGAGFRDGAGDRVTTMTVEGPVERIEVKVEGTVETSDTSGVLRGHRETVWPRVYLAATAMTQPSRVLADFRTGAMRGLKEDGALARAHRLANAVAEAVHYTPGATEAHTTAAEVLEQGAGVCQDHAHVLIALALIDGLPARYVTGYLLAREDGEPEEASHAWAEVHVEGLGWVGFDPANACCPDERYIRLGSGRDARLAAPIRGVSRGVGAEMMDVSVVVAAQQ